MNIQQPFEPDNTLTRITNALSLKLDQRCADLSILLERANKQILHTAFPILIENIFGPQGSFSWNLNQITAATDSSAFINTINFLKPTGALFKVIYTLLQDVNIKYEFNIALLPAKVRQMLDGLNVNPFYNEIVQYTNHQNGRQMMCLVLNPFDYYIFHFIHYLINPSHQRVGPDDDWTTVYFNLATEYLRHFFPTYPGMPIEPSLTFYHGKNPTQSMQHIIKPYKQSTLLKQNLFGDPTVNDIKVMHQHIEKHPRNEIWRSETILVAIIDLWLSNDQVCSQHDSLNMSGHSELPSSDYIRILRVAVKHLHAFASSAHIDNSALGELKKHTIPMMQSRMYIFLRNLLHRWPLDESFRYVLELWLSFIQPWRYSFETYNKKYAAEKTPGELEEVKCADASYMNFIAENFLVYVVILQQLLPRFTRIDLSSPKDAYMLFRLAKVFNQRNLVPILKRIEALVENKSYSPPHHTSLNYSSILPPLSPTSRWSTNSTQIYSSTQIMSESLNITFEAEKLFGINNDNFSSKFTSIVRQKIYELEGPTFRYYPMFICKPANEVYELLRFIKASEVRAVTIVEECKAKNNEETGFWSLFFGQPRDQLETSLIDRQKAALFLKNSVDYLIEIFDVKDFSNLDITPEHIREIKGMDHSSQEENSYPMVLTPSKVRERLMNMKYEGDPDLMPITSFEVAFIVRMLYSFCLALNEKYGHVISKYYFNRGFAGRFASNFIQEPLQVFKYEKHRGCSRRIMYNLPPRLSMRKFANRNFVLCIAGGSCLTAWISWGWWLFIAIYLFAYICVALWRATFKPRYLPTVHLSFNDSLED